MNMEHVTANRNNKDTVFRMLFKNKENLLSLYNALNDTKYYMNADELEVVTLENAIYMAMKNDLAFLLDYRMYLYEHQSTHNPNMPLRDLFYVTSEYQKMVLKESLYASAAVSIPAPRFVVFYNGIEERPEREVLKLSDLYTIWEEKPMLELQVQVLNINDGYNSELKEKCDTLREYMSYVGKIRKYKGRGLELNQAVERAVEECLEEDILVDFILSNRAEVIAMSIFEYNEEEEKRKFREAESRKAKKEAMEAAEKMVEEMAGKMAEEIAEKKAEKKWREGLTEGEIKGTICTCKLLEKDRSGAKDILCREYSITDEKADEYLYTYWKSIDNN